MNWALDCIKYCFQHAYKLLCNLPHALTDSHAHSAEAKHISLIGFPSKLTPPALRYAADSSRGIQTHAKRRTEGQEKRELDRLNGSLYRVFVSG